MSPAWNRIVNALLGLMALVYGSFISKALWDNVLYHSPPTVLVTKAAIINKVVSGGTVDLVLNGAAVNESCEQIYLLGSVVDANNNEILLDKIITIDSGRVNDLLDKSIMVHLPDMTPGPYKFRAEIHEICHKKSAIILAPLISFTVLDAPNISK